MLAVKLQSVIAGTTQDGLLEAAVMRTLTDSRTAQAILCMFRMFRTVTTCLCYGAQGALHSDKHSFMNIYRQRNL